MDRVGKVDVPLPDVRLKRPRHFRHANLHIEQAIQPVVMPPHGSGVAIIGNAGYSAENPRCLGASKWVALFRPWCSLVAARAGLTSLPPSCTWDGRSSQEDRRVETHLDNELRVPRQRLAGTAGGRLFDRALPARRNLPVRLLLFLLLLLLLLILFLPAWRNRAVGEMLFE